MKLCLLLVLGATTPVFGSAAPLPQGGFLDDVEYSCGQEETITIEGRIRSYVSDAYAQGEGTSADDLALHNEVLEVEAASTVTCIDPDGCKDGWPAWECAPEASIVFGTSVGSAHPTLPGYMYIHVNTQVTRGCTECID